jgi:peptide/nickel transport system substrate-binding protein
MRSVIFAVVVTCASLFLPAWLFSQGDANTLRICDLTSDDGLRMDPHMEWEERNENILNQIFEHLLELDIDGNPSPSLAKSWKRLDQHRIQFKLNENVYFHNNEPCDANAVKFSLERNIRKGPKVPNYHVVKSIKQVEVINRTTFNIVTHYPDGILLHRLCQSGFILPPRYLQKVADKEFEKRPVGTGPFKFARWTRGKEIVLEKNHSYWRQGMPYLDRIVYRFGNASQRAKMLLAGDVDMITDLNPEDLPEIERRGFRTFREPSFTVMSINFNLRKGKGPLQDKRVRKALNHAVDVNALIEEARRGAGIRLATMGMPGEFGYDPYIKPYAYDPEKARQLLREAGFPKGFDATILIDDIDGGAEGVFGKALKKQLARVGINLRIEGGNCSLRIAEPRLKENLPPFSLDMAARTCPDPLGHVIFNTGMLWYGSDSPWSLLNDPEFDRLYEKIVRTVNLREQTRLCHKMQEMIHENAYSLFAYQSIKLYAMDRKVRYTPYMTGALYLRDARIVYEY